VSGESIRDRLSALSRGELIGVVAVAAVTVLGAGLWYLRSLPAPVEVRDGGAPVARNASAGSPSATPVPILVDVAGWVRHPGVYELASGQRVVDAIRAAGGARPGALLESLNLAAPLADGIQILVPKQGVAPAAVPGSAGASTAGALVNVNTATAAELEALPGIGEVIAQAIVDYRTQNGPFGTVDELLDVSGIGDATLANIRDLVTV
jgi:competence protein ComEA